MANTLADRIRQLTLSKIDFVHPDASAIVDGLVSEALNLDDAGDAFSVLAGDDVDQDDIANAVVDLADIFDDVDLSPDQTAKLDSVVDRLLKSGTPEQKQAAKNLFSGALGFGIKAKVGNAFFDDLLATEPA